MKKIFLSLSLILSFILPLSIYAATNEITGRQILDKTITDNDIANGTIQSLQIADKTIVDNDIANGTITTLQISDNTITNGDLAGGSANPFVAITINSNTSAIANRTYFVDTSGGAVSLTLPSPALTSFIIVKDNTGSFNTNNLTIVRNGAEEIEGIAASKILSSGWSSVTFVSDGTDWFMF